MSIIEIEQEIVDFLNLLKCIEIALINLAFPKSNLNNLFIFSNLKRGLEKKIYSKLKEGSES